MTVNSELNHDQKCRRDPSEGGCHVLSHLSPLYNRATQIFFMGFSPSNLQSPFLWNVPLA